MSVVAEVSAIDFAETEFDWAQRSTLIREVDPLVPGPPSLAMCLSERRADWSTSLHCFSRLLGCFDRRVGTGIRSSFSPDC